MKKQIDNKLYADIGEIIISYYCILFFIMEFFVKNSIKFLNSILSFTTDGWMSRTIESYLSLIIHITYDFNMHHFMFNLHQVKNHIQKI